MAQLDNDVLDVFAHHIDINSEKRTVKLTTTLERDLYERVIKVLSTYGATYKGSFAKGTAHHVFPSDPAPMIELILATKSPNPADFYPTPDNVADYLVTCLDLGSLPPNATGLEPHFGTGALVRAVERAAMRLNRQDITMHGVERNPGLVERAHAQGYMVYCADFSRWYPDQHYQFMLMNPPFREAQTSNGRRDANAYIDHIVRAWTMLAPGGRLVTIAPVGWTFRERDQPASLPLFFEEVQLSIAQFRLFVETYGCWAELRAGLFEENGTGARVTVIRLHRDDPPAPLPEPPDHMKREGFRTEETPHEHPLVILQRALQHTLESDRHAHALLGMLSSIFNEPIVRITPCPRCGEEIEAGIPTFSDACKRYWHLSCAELVLGSIPAAVDVIADGRKRIDCLDVVDLSAEEVIA